MRVHAAATRGKGSAIVTAHSADTERTVITAIERLPYDAGAVSRRLLELKAADPTARIVLDEEGLGDAVWELVGKPRRGQGWRLYARHGFEREELTRTLLVGVERASFGFASGLREADAMRKALVGLTRNPREDGPGSELAVALSLALDDRRPPLPRVG